MVIILASVAVQPAAVVSVSVEECIPTSAAPGSVLKPDHVVVGAAISTIN